MRNVSITALEVAQAASGPLQGKWAVVTGGNSGIGLETCRALFMGGANVVLCSRSEAAGEQAAQKLRAEASKGEVVVEQLDLGSLANVRGLAARLAQRLPDGAPDLLVLNAGVMATPCGTLTSDGFEAQIGVNFMGHQALAQAMLPAMRAAEKNSTRGPGRVAVLTSISHKWATLHLDDLNFQRRRYSPWVAYAESKLCCILLAKELARRLQEDGSAIRVAAVHPGVIFTGLTRNRASGCMGLLVKCLLAPVSKTPEQGAATTVHALVADDYPSGSFLADCAVAEPGAAALDVAAAKSLVEQTAIAIAKVLDAAPTGNPDSPRPETLAVGGGGGEGAINQHPL